MSDRRKPVRQRSVFNARKEEIKDKRLSTCVPCNKGVFEGRDDYIYTNTGYYHTKCLEADETSHAA